MNEVKVKEKTTKKESIEMFDSKKEPRKSLQTFLRNQNKLHTNSFNMIDRKAAIMIRVNSMIISAIVIFFSKVEDIPNGYYIGVILIISCFLSLMFALNASRPHTINKLYFFRKSIRKGNVKPEERIFLSGAAADLSIAQYEEAFSKIVHNQSLQIGNQVRGMQALEKDVRNSFIYIEISYLAFMIGFVSTVVLFIIAKCF